MAIIKILRYILCIKRDFVDFFKGHRDPMIPPTRLMFDGTPDFLEFKKNGNEFFHYFKDICRLKPSEKILDIGSGIGRKTIPLTKYLTRDGLYEGFDINKIGVAWCRQKIQKKYQNFHFQAVDVYNKYYNQKGKVKASDFIFPFESNFFDFVILGSVFTHMLPKDVENYISETSRVLKKNGRCLITFFLLNKQSNYLIGQKKSSLDFKYQLENCKTTNARIPEDAICYNESFIRLILKKYHLKIKEPIHYGSWCGRNKFFSYQDIVIAIKPK